MSWNGVGYTPNVIATFTIPGNPKPKERPRVVRGHTYTPDATVAAETAVLDAFYDTYPFWTPVETLVGLTVRFYRETRVRADIDNLVKLIQDALNRHLYLDDVQIVRLEATKEYAGKGNGRTVVTVTEIGGAP
jgi:Holliday junction resolvase RusA-like endonuclease